MAPAWGVPNIQQRYRSNGDCFAERPDRLRRSVLGHRCLSGLNVAKDVLVKTRPEFDFFREVRASLEYKIAHQGKVLYDRRQEPTRAKLAHQGEA